MGEICCSPGGARITKVRVGDYEVGLVAIGELFDKFYEAGKKPEYIDRQDLVSEASLYNYIPSAAWDEYAKALLEEYKKYCVEKAK